jgi:hypothetical protein
MGSHARQRSVDEEDVGHDRQQAHARERPP